LPSSSSCYNSLATVAAVDVGCQRQFNSLQGEWLEAPTGDL